MNYTESLESAMFQLWDDDYDEEKIIGFLNASENFSTFGEALERFIDQRKSTEYEKSAEDYLKKCLKDKHLQLNRNTLKNWFVCGNRPKKGAQSREHMYIISFALDLSIEDTIALFQKVYFDRAFNARNPKEFIYYYCIRNRLSYQHATALLEKIHITPFNTNDLTMSTKLLTADIAEFLEDQAVVDYMESHAHNFELNNTGAKRILQNLLNEIQAKETDREKLQKRTVDKSCGLITQELYHHPEVTIKYKTLTSISTMLDVMINIDFVKEREEREKSIFKNANLPSEIRQNFPTKHTFSKSEPSYEELRKMIILLFSYKFWFQKEYENNRVDLDDYASLLDTVLQEAGLQLLYYGNPYDWLFLYCSVYENSLDIFRSIMAEVFLQEE